MKNLFPFNKDKVFSYLERGNNSPVILKELSCFTECVSFKRLWSDPKILRFIFRFMSFLKWPEKA